MHGPAAVEAVAEGDKDCCVGSQHGRPGWAPGLSYRVLHQAPGPDPALYHRGSEMRRVGWEAYGEGEDGGGEGSRSEATPEASSI